MTSIYKTTFAETLINRGLNLDMRSINSLLTQLFLQYRITLNKIKGGELLGFGDDQVRQIQDVNGIPKEYSKGQIVFKNRIDKLKFLLEHRNIVAKAIGVSSWDIWDSKKNLGKINEYIYMMDGKFDLGNPEGNMQMYISRHDGNTGMLDSDRDWIEYILTSDWVDDLASRCAGLVSSDRASGNRTQYIVDMVSEMMKDHEVDYHKTLQDFNSDDFVDIGQPGTVQDAMNRLCSMGILQYGFCEIYKPIGGSKTKHIRARISTSGDIEISGVVGLEDCEHVEWEYGSPDYLRSLNNGNQMYEFNISLPINTLDSVLWRKLDEPEDVG